MEKPGLTRSPSQVQDRTELVARGTSFEQSLENARLLICRLERLSADSYWAHQASGLRGSLLRSLEQVRESQATNADGSADDQIEKLNQLIDKGFVILVRAAREVSCGS